MSDQDEWFQHDRELLAVLTYFDRTTGPTGASLTLEERREELTARHGACSAPIRVLDLVRPEAEPGRNTVRVGYWTCSPHPSFIADTFAPSPVETVNHSLVVPRRASAARV